MKNAPRCQLDWHATQFAIVAIVSSPESTTAWPLGWNDHWAALWAKVDDHSLVPVRVTRIDKGGITISKHRGHEQLAVAAKAVRSVVVGDFCGVDPKVSRIEVILERRTVFERRSPGVTRDSIELRSRAVASNMDKVFLLHALSQQDDDGDDPLVNIPRLIRELVLAYESGAEPVVVLTKADLVDDATRSQAVAMAAATAPNLAVMAVSNTSGLGVAEFRRNHVDGATSTLIGASGAGKSSLVNALAGYEVQPIGEVRESDGRGRHTTTAGQLIALDDETLLIDTPGIRGVGLWAARQGLDRVFDDVVSRTENCRFGDCTHENEPGCELREAIESGVVSNERVALWRTLGAELDALDAELEVAERELVRSRNQRARRRVRRRDSRLEE